MAILEDVEVTIIAGNSAQPLEEYNDPDPDPEAPATEREVVKYIEAQSEAEFQINVTLKKGFCYHGASGVRLWLKLDGDALNVCWYKPIDTHGLDSHGKLLQNFSHTISESPHKKGDDWYKVSYTFGAASVNEDLRLEKEILAEQFLKLGSIEMRVERVRSRAKESTRHGDRPLNPTKDLDKKLLIKSITHTFKPGKMTITEEPRLQNFEVDPLPGDYGQPFAFRFLYRSRLALQTLGCIRITPEPVPLSERSPADMTDEEKANQIVSLRAENDANRKEIQQLMQAAQAQAQDLKVKMATLQSALGGLNAMATPSSSPIGVKRERIKTETVGESETPTRTAKRSKPDYVRLDD